MFRTLVPRSDIDFEAVSERFNKNFYIYNME